MSVLGVLNAIAPIQFAFNFQLCPIFLTGGIATNMPGGTLPIIYLTEGGLFPAGLLGGGLSNPIENYFANFEPLPGSSLIEQEVGHYTFANQTVAANAVIQQPLKCSLLMKCPVRAANGGWPRKLATITALQQTLLQHNNSGGMYTVATPSFFYTNGLFLLMTDADTGESKQKQLAYRLDFEFPLLTQQQATQAQNSLMSKISNGAPITGQPQTSGLPATVGQPSSLAAPSISPPSGAAGSGVAGPSGGASSGPAQISV